MHEKLLNEYGAGADWLRAAIAGMSAEEIHARPVADKWTTQEVVCHVADTEGMLADRIKRILAEERPLMLNADETLWVAALGCSWRLVEQELQYIAAVRGQMKTILTPLPIAAWQRVGIHSIDGERTLLKIVETAVAHLRHHLDFILEKRRALGHDVTMVARPWQA